MNAKENLKRRVDQTYEMTAARYPDVRCACYGVRYYWCFLSREFEYTHFYLTDSALLYTRNGFNFTEIPFESICKVTVKRSRIAKTMYHIRLTAKKKYHFAIYERAYLSSEQIGDELENVRQLLDTLASAVKENDCGFSG